MSYLKSVVLFIGFTAFIKISAAQESFQSQASDKRNSIEFTPKMSVALFTAQQKITGTAYGMDLAYHYNTEGIQTAWLEILNVTSIGLVFNYADMSRVTIVDESDPYKFRNSYALMGSFNMTLLKRKNMELGLAPSFGIGYMDETFFTNQNRVIGSHVNFTARAAARLFQNVTPKTKLAVGLDIMHFSNAAARVPNNGLNSVNLHLGVVQLLKPRAERPADSSNTWASRHHYKTHSFDFGIAMGRRGRYQNKDDYFYKTSIYGGYNYRLNPVIGLSAGIDAIYYHSVFDPNRFEETYQSYASSFDHWRVGAAIGSDIWMNRLALTLRYGYYLHYNSYKNTKVYWTAGLKYNLLDWLALQGRMHVHTTEADFAAFGLLFTL